MVQDNVNALRQNHVKTKRETLLKGYLTNQHTNNANVMTDQMKWSCYNDDAYWIDVGNKLRILREKFRVWQLPVFRYL